MRADHDKHILFSYFYFTFACLNNSALFFALAPEISARYLPQGHGVCSFFTVRPPFSILF
eukprot:COSAG06_NODE_2276_length_7193_cov_7.259374_2_plen_60_part_00